LVLLIYLSGDLQFKRYLPVGHLSCSRGVFESGVLRLNLPRVRGVSLKRGIYDEGESNISPLHNIDRFVAALKSDDSFLRRPLRGLGWSDAIGGVWICG
jgi:hypothetical protein